MATAKYGRFTRRGHTLGFARTGETVIGYTTRTGAYRVAVAQGHAEILCDPRNKNFGDQETADLYAKSLINKAKTEELKWW